MTAALLEEATFDLTYEGLVAAHTEPDKGGFDAFADNCTGDTWAIETLRVHGHDLIAALAGAVEDLRQPIMATATVDGAEIASGRLRFTRGYGEMGCGDGCCGGVVDHEVMVGATDVLDHLNRLHGSEHEVRLHGQGYVPPTVDVTFAHHTWSPVNAAPGDRMVLSLDVAKKLRYRVTTASRDRIDTLAKQEWSALR